VVESAAVAPATLSESRLRRVLAVLCVTQTVSWGVLYYAFAVLAPSIAADTGWSLSATTAAFSAGLAVSAVVGIPVGHWLDRVGPHLVMTVGSLIGVPAVLGIALAPGIGWFVVGWLVAGVGMAGTLYPPAFAAVTRWWGPRRVGALTALTLLAGLSSTIFAPVTAALLGQLGWRHSYLVLAVVLAGVTIPAHLFGLRGPWPDPDPTGRADHADRSGLVDHSPAAVARSRPFLLLVAALALAAFAAFAVVVNQVPLLIERGMSTGGAAWALGLGGLGQVLGRLGYCRLVAVTGVRGRTTVILALSAVATALLAVLPGPAVLLIAAAMLAGAARGVLTLLQATAITDRWGAVHYGRLNGLASAPALVAIAVAPWAGAALAGLLGGYPAVFAILAGCAALAAVLAAGSVPRPPTSTPT
jgi:MFS family permease